MNKPFQCSYGRNSPQRRRSAARVEQGDLFKFYEAQREILRKARLAAACLALGHAESQASMGEASVVIGPDHVVQAPVLYCDDSDLASLQPLQPPAGNSGCGVFR